MGVPVTTAEAGDGAEGLAAVKAAPAPLDVVLVDRCMPNTNGREMVQAVRGLGLRVPVIMVPTDGEKDRVLQAIKAGANNDVLKPFKAEDQVAKVTATPRVARFVRHAGYRTYAAVRSVYPAMLDSDDAKVVGAAAGQSSVTALAVDEAAPDADGVRSGRVTRTTAAASAYAVNVADARVGRKCRDLLKGLLADADEAVRVAAASALRHPPPTRHG